MATRGTGTPYYPQLYGRRWWLECIHAGPSAVDTISLSHILDRALRKRFYLFIYFKKGKRAVAEESLPKEGKI